MFEIVVLVPTRGRPDNAKRLYTSLMDTANRGFGIEFCVDEDDPYLEAYLEALPGGTVSVGSPNRLGPWLNIASKAHLGNYDIIGFIGDDVISRTYGWDEDVREAYGPNMIAYPNDGHQGPGLPTSVFMDSDLIWSLGYMVNPAFKHLYIDNHWKRLGEELDTLTYLPEVNMEHMHPFAGKAPEDATYRAANSPEQYSTDGQAFMIWEQRVLPIDVIRAMEGGDGE